MRWLFAISTTLPPDELGIAAQPGDQIRERHLLDARGVLVQHEVDERTEVVLGLGTGRRRAQQRILERTREVDRDPEAERLDPAEERDVRVR